MLGAYGSAMRTGFNGFGNHDTVLVTDGPMASAYGVSEDRRVLPGRKATR
jgi:ornithine decarboxylase